MREDLRAAFEELKRALRGLQSGAARGDTRVVAEELAECLACTEELQAVVLPFIPADDSSA